VKATRLPAVALKRRRDSVRLIRRSFRTKNRL